MTDHTITTFTFDELSPEAQETALEWYRSGYLEGDEWWEFVYEDFERITKILGIELYQKPTNRVRQDNMIVTRPAIWFSGFWSQGDGACYEGVYRYAKGSAKKIREYNPNDTELHRIADELAALQKVSGYQLTARIGHSGRYYHKYTMGIDVEHGLDWVVLSHIEDELIEALRDLAQWLYERLEQEYEGLMSEENLKESLEAGDYEFTEDGRVWHG